MNEKYFVTEPETLKGQDLFMKQKKLKVSNFSTDSCFVAPCK